MTKSKSLKILNEIIEKIEKENKRQKKILSTLRKDSLLNNLKDIN